MSFRKRGEVIGVPGRGPAVPGRTPAVPGRGVPAAGVAGAARELARGSVPSPRAAPNQEDVVAHNPAVRPSTLTSEPTISTGGSDLDKLLLHQGLPLGTSLLIEESGTTDFASVILRAFVSQGVVHNRITKDELHAHVIVVGLSPQWAKDLPGLYKGTSKEQKKARILENESKVSVSNMASGGSSNTRNADLKIAWRYGLKKNETSDSGPQDLAAQTTYEHYSNQFDLTQKLVPGPSGHDISFVPLSANFGQISLQIISIIKSQLKKNPATVVRIAVPGLLNPSVYSPVFATPSYVVPLVHSLRSVLRQFSTNVALVASLPLDLYPRHTSVTGTLELLFDSVIHLQPFNQEMSQMIEKAYKNEPAKIQQGLVHILKLPVLSEKGLMMVHEGEYAFKNGRKKFEIEEWGIPVEDDGDEQQTTKNIDF